MRAVGLKILKNKLSEYVRLVTGGETVLVTNQGRVVAELVPPQQGRSPFPADAQLAAAVSKGWITPPTMPTRGAPPRLPVAPLEEILQEILDDGEAR